MSVQEEIEPIPFGEIIKEEGKSTISFKLPFELVETDDTYNVVLSGILAQISIEKISVLNHFEQITGLRATTRGSGKVEILGDTRGISVITQVTINLPFITNPHYFTQISLEYLNRLLDVWRAITGKYWFKEAVSDNDIKVLHYEIIKTNGGGQKGSYYFGLPGKIKLSSRVMETEKALPIIIKHLQEEIPVPLYVELILNARKHYIERQYNLAVIELNIAFEEYVTKFLVHEMIENKFDYNEISRRLNRYDNLHKKMERGFKEIFGIGLKKDKELWDLFEKMRLIRKNIIHPFVKKASYVDAKETFRTFDLLTSWIKKIR